MPKKKIYEFAVLRDNHTWDDCYFQEATSAKKAEAQLLKELRSANNVCAVVLMNISDKEDEDA